MAAEEGLSPDVRDAVRALRGGRGPCPPADTLVEYHERSEAGRQSHAAHDHVQICSRCQLVLLHLEEPQAPSRSVQRWALPLAAALALAVLSPFVYRSLAPSPAPLARPDTVRGTDLQPVAPVGDVRELREFTWQSPIAATRYRVRVYRGAVEIWSATSDTTRVSSTPPRLEPGVEYAWQVEALDREGAVRLQSPRQPFTLR